MPLHPAPNWYSVSSLKGLWILFRQGNERLDRHSAHTIVRSPVRMPFSGTFNRWAECRRGGGTARLPREEQHYVNVQSCPPLCGPERKGDVQGKRGSVDVDLGVRRTT